MTITENLSRLRAETWRRHCEGVAIQEKAKAETRRLLGFPEWEEMRRKTPILRLIKA